MPSRRNILIAATVTSAAAPLLAKAQAELVELTPDEPIAVALGYQTNASLVDTKKFPKRGTSAGKTQFCDNCALYEETAPGLGTCTAIRGKLVAGKGWCNAWIPQP